MAAHKFKAIFSQVQAQLKMRHFSHNISCKSLIGSSCVTKPITLTRVIESSFRPDLSRLDTLSVGMFGDYSSTCTWAGAEEENRGPIPERWMNADHSNKNKDVHFSPLSGSTSYLLAQKHVTGPWNLNWRMKVNYEHSRLHNGPPKYIQVLILGTCEYFLIWQKSALLVWLS